MLYGTAAPLRQVLYAKDLANILASMVKNDLYENFNIASPDNLTIHDIARVALDSLGLNHFEIEYDNTMPDGQYRKDVCINKFKSYFPNFQFTSLSDGIKEVYAAVFRNI
jgi:GDP-L-fucose synthase